MTKGLAVKRDNMKPILVDSLYIHMSGALGILNHLVDNLVRRKVNFVLLKDSRAPELNSEKHIDEVVVMKASERSRKLFYKQHRDYFSTVLCMGNVPPTIKMPCKVHTYFHNVSLLVNPKSVTIKRAIKNHLKKLFLQYYAKNTDTWLVQTQHTQNLVQKYLPCKNKEVRQFPIYKIPHELDELKNVEHGKDYVFIGYYTQAKGHEVLLEAWRQLKKQGYRLTLHLTVQESNNLFYKELKEAEKENLGIINHGAIPFEQVIKLYQQSKSIVYPSCNESLGLGIIEALHAGCDVISANLPYAYSVCEPSEVFNPYRAESIVEAVKKYEHGTSPKSQLKIRDMVDDMIDFIMNPSI